MAGPCLSESQAQYALTRVTPLTVAASRSQSSREIRGWEPEAAAPSSTTVVGADAAVCPADSGAVPGVMSTGLSTVARLGCGCSTVDSRPAGGGAGAGEPYPYAATTLPTPRGRRAPLIP